MRLKDRVALITGASGGMGAATARIFVREGAKVAICDVLEAEGKAVAKELGDAAIFVKLDVTKAAEWEAAVAATVKAFGKLDILVNNAGISGSGYTDDLMNEDGWDKLMAINAKGPFLGMKYAIPEMQKVGKGSVINISSISGVTGQGYLHYGYNASKGAVRLMTKSAAHRHGKENIRVNSVHPGIMPPMRTSVLTADPAHRKRMLAPVPMGRTGEVDEVGNAILFLASDESSYVTGTELHVDGGFLAV